MSNQEYDYTKDDATATSDDFEIKSFTPPAQSADEIEKANGFREIKPGEHVLVVSQVFINDPKHFKVMLNGQMASYLSRTLSVRFALPNDPRATVQDGFTLPPENPADHRAYNEGTSVPKPGDKPKENDKGGFAANKFTHFLARMNLLTEDGQMTPAGQSPSSWKGRAIVATVTAGRGTYVNKDGQEVPSSNQVKLFSYKPANAASMSTASTAAAGVASSPGARSPQAAAAPQSRMAAVGMDDL